MAMIPPVILVLDINALSAATPREWLEFSRVGSCIIPQVVYEEMKLLFDRSPDPDLERIAKAFNRFYPSSGWKISEASAHHSLLKASSSQGLTKRARVSLAVGRCAYALSLSFPASLVVLVSSDRAMLQRVYDIQGNNFCAITGQSLLQWCRTGQRPIAVTQKLQILKASGNLSSAGDLSTGFTSQTNVPPTTRIQDRTSTSGRTTSVRATSPVRRSNSARRTSITAAKPMDDVWPQVISFVIAFVALAAAGYLIWLLIHHGGIREIFQNSEDGVIPAEEIQQ
jgi:hypothetical protein